MRSVAGLGHTVVTFLRGGEAWCLTACLHYTAWARRRQGATPPLPRRRDSVVAPAGTSRRIVIPGCASASVAGRLGDSPSSADVSESRRPAHAIRPGPPGGGPGRAKLAAWRAGPVGGPGRLARPAKRPARLWPCAGSGGALARRHTQRHSGVRVPAMRRWHARHLAMRRRWRRLGLPRAVRRRVRRTVAPHAMPRAHACRARMGLGQLGNPNMYT